MRIFCQHSWIEQLGTLRLDEIRNATKRLPFGPSHLSTIITFLTKEKNSNLIVLYHPKMGINKTEWQSSMDDGVLMFSCPQLELDFLLVHGDNGQGFFGGQKAIFQTYLGDGTEDNFGVGASFRSFTLALFAINNVFRGNGFLKGGAY